VEYTDVIEGLQECGYHCQSRVLNCADHSDHTSRRRWFCIGMLHNGAIEWPVPLTVFPGLFEVLDDPKTVCLARIVHQFETQELTYLLVCCGAHKGRRALSPTGTHTHTHMPNDGIPQQLRLPGRPDFSSPQRCFFFC
jgi:site-specific DNA-cytosine methylase